MSPDHIRLPFVPIAGPDELPVDDVAARSPNPPKFAADHAPPFDSTRTVPVFHKRITFCLNVHNDAVKAMSYPPDTHKGELPDAEAVKERQREEQELAEALAEDDYD